MSTSADVAEQFMCARVINTIWARGAGFVGYWAVGIGPWAGQRRKLVITNFESYILYTDTKSRCMGPIAWCAARHRSRRCADMCGGHIPTLDIIYVPKISQQGEKRISVQVMFRR